MRTRTLLILAAVAVLLAVIVAIDDTEYKPAGDTGIDARLLPAFNRDDMAKIVISGKSRRRVVLQRDDDRWWIHAPEPQLPALSSEVERILSALEFARSLRRLPAAADLHNWGLTPPRLRIQLIDRHKNTTDMVFGNADASGVSVYVSVGQQVHLASAVLFDALDNDAAVLRDQSLIPFPASAFTEIDLVGPPRIHLKRKGRGWVTATEQGWLIANSNRVQRWVGQFASLMARRFVHVNDSHQTDGQSFVRVDGEIVKLKVGSAACGGAKRPERRVTRWWRGHRLDACIDERDWQQLIVLENVEAGYDSK